MKRCRYINGFGENCESPVYAEFSDGALDYVVVRDWRLMAPRIVLADEVKFLQDEGVFSGDKKAPASLSQVPAELRSAIIEQLVDEVNDMSTDELVFLMLEGMDADELKARWEEIVSDDPSCGYVFPDPETFN